MRYRTYLFLLFLACFILALPLRFVETIRVKVIGSFAPVWSGLQRTSARENAELERLRLENYNLRSQMQTIRQWLLFEDRLEEQLERLAGVCEEEEPDKVAFFRRRWEHLSQLVAKQYYALPAEVIFREPSTWNSSVWLNVGEKDNEALGRVVVAENSPVLLGSSVVGVVEFVGAAKSRVRLMSDSRAHIAVRAVRGGENHRLLYEQIEALILSLTVDLKVENREELLELLYGCKSNLHQAGVSSYLAKGELHGSGRPLWRSRGQTLIGEGFNYDYPDAEGPARALRSSEEILQVGDLLVTSGLDGVFPPDLPVAIVTSISPLREGACSYALQAKALSTHLDELRFVYVLPPFAP